MRKVQGQAKKLKQLVRVRVTSASRSQGQAQAAIAREVHSAEVGLKSSQKVRSVGQSQCLDQGDTQPGTGTAAIQGPKT